MNLRIPIVVAILIAALSSSAAADARGVMIGGYDVTKIASATIDLLVEKRALTEAEALKLEEGLVVALPSDPLIAGVPIVALYEQLGDHLIERGITTPAEITALKKQASASGGVKVAGMNPVVLAASYLDLLARKGLISVSEAQAFLDAAK